MTRSHLPERRPNTTLRLQHSNQTFFVSLGWDVDNGMVQEVFGSTAKATSDFAMLLSDACITLSIALQRGATPQELAHSLNRVPVLGNAKRVEGPASVIGVIVEAIIAETSAIVDTMLDEQP